MRKPIEKLGLQKKFCKFRVSCFHVSEIGKWDQCHVNKTADRQSQKIRTAQADRLAGRTRVFNHIYITNHNDIPEHRCSSIWKCLSASNLLFFCFFFLLKIRSRTKSVSVFPHRSWLFHDSLVVWILIAFPIVSATYLSHWNQILTPRWETGDRPLSLSLSASCLLSPVCVCVLGSLSLT